MSGNIGYVQNVDQVSHCDDLYDDDDLQCKNLLFLIRLYEVWEVYGDPRGS